MSGRGDEKGVPISTPNSSVPTSMPITATVVLMPPERLASGRGQVV